MIIGILLSTFGYFLAGMLLSYLFLDLLDDSLDAKGTWSPNARRAYMIVGFVLWPIMLIFSLFWCIMKSITWGIAFLKNPRKSRW